MTAPIVMRPIKSVPQKAMEWVLENDCKEWTKTELAERSFIAGYKDGEDEMNGACLFGGAVIGIILTCLAYCFCMWIGR